MKPLLTTMSSSDRTRHFLQQGLLLLSLLIFYQLKAQLPPAVQEIIDTSIKNWNEFYGANVKAVSWSYEGLIATELQRTEAINEITDPAKAWVPKGDILVPSSVTADRVINNTTLTQTDIDDWKHTVDSLLKVGQHKVRLQWTKGSQTFTSLCITDNAAPVYDDMLINIALADHQSVCLDYRIGWIWQRKFANRTRGFISAEIIINCDNLGTLISCDKQCLSGMSLGSAKINCQSVPIPGRHCCQLTYSWAWSVGFTKIKLKADKFTLELEGDFGAAGEGSCTECCKSTFDKPPTRIIVSSKCETEQALINWEAIGTARFRKYTVESSIDGITWNVAGYVDAGFSPTPPNGYSFKDVNTTKGNFYRVIAEEVTGNKTYSSLIASACGAVQNISIWPNPAGNIATIRMPSPQSGILILRVSNSRGIEVLRQQYNLHVGNNQFQVDMKNFASGIYTFSASSGGLHKVYKIIKADNR